MLRLLIILFLSLWCGDIVMDEDNKKAAAYALAQQMDAQGAEWKREQDQDKLDHFLNTIAMIESSGGKNFDHAQIQSGMHQGHKAAGTYGLMPNTVYDVLNQMRKEAPLEYEMQQLKEFNPREVKAAIERNPEIERKLAEKLATHVLDKQGGDEEKAAYSWFQGHNLSPESIDNQNYAQHDYVQKYKKYKGDE